MADDAISEFEATLIRTTAKAMCVEIDGDEYWIPTSLVLDGTEDLDHAGDIGTLVIPRWKAVEMGLEK